MNGIQATKSHSTEKPSPGCLGRMVNLFDLSSGVPGNRLLTDKPHYDDSSLTRSRSVVARTWSPFGDQIEEKIIVHNIRGISNNEANGTPMKILINQEMEKEGESKYNPPNVVAKLMGLDALPRPQPDSASKRNHAKGYSRRSLSHSGIALGSWQEEDGFSDKGLPCDRCPQQTTYVRHKSPQKGRHDGKIDDKKMDLVRRKFMEAKRLATDEKLRQSKEFQDALEVLSSNEDLFHKLLQEPNALFSQRLDDLKSTAPPPETKRITVLRPSKMVDGDKFQGSGRMSDKQIKMPAQVGQALLWGKNDPGYSPTYNNQKGDEFPGQPTRIVVLKPSPGKPHDIKAVVSSPSLSPRILHRKTFYEEAEDDEAQESREVAKEITRQMRENLMGHQMDETLLSCVFSHGYTGNDSSFDKSENESAVEDLSDSEVMSPSPRHSWDYINRFGSPCSSSSFSRVSCSPESSVCREAKKRLSERWAMMASVGSSQDQRHGWRNSSTLGEMLALADSKKLAGSEDKNINKEQESVESGSCLSNNVNKEECLVVSPKNLLRSKSVPVSSTMSGTRLNVEVSEPEAGKMHVPKELTKAKSMKSSFKGKVSSLFFSRNKKSSKDRHAASQFKDESQYAGSEAKGSLLHSLGVTCDATSQLADGGLCSAPHGPSGETSPDTSMGQKQGTTWEAGFSVKKHIMPGNISENQDQPSPISVLEPPFEDDNTSLEAFGNMKPDHQGRQLPIKSNLIDKSPPIESIARTLYWDDSCPETATGYTEKPSVSPGSEVEEQDWLALAQTLLSMAGLNGEVQSEKFSARWHSLDSPLDPSLRDKVTAIHGKNFLPEAKRRQNRSNWKLIFDCVNAALMEITGYGSTDKYPMGRPCNGANSRLLESASPMLVDWVWNQMQEWISSEGRCDLWDGEDSNSLVVERLVRKEVVGKGWEGILRLEIYNIGKEIVGKLLEELVAEALVDC
ncbi:hypothetical protein I3760_04G190700 [Carya illinoinensis]|uniref:DUF4378 domain-containing protein n=1 Tax=Carya illinoinensis TaxID=32201 RepID=A0A922FAR0_CARIL|nr:hypothetical protein I3760_04G190700 [Carya illinoinensis]KAG2713759.1 hypothetical protein I3760_04G190700 [Carya illinoinensis]KAG2713760.1 hypothetical protein I3760_04G190700 [Carya illinoinensis]KAG2713766.1 hypothetical protein I3760_04G190700 [Carya illinoinensis]KAG2713767.1 hypothetical protein I3760_04G190700 [Carya illinoinensis]